MDDVKLVAHLGLVLLGASSPCFTLPNQPQQFDNPVPSAHILMTSFTGSEGLALILRIHTEDGQGIRSSQELFNSEPARAAI